MREKKLVSLFALNPGDLCLPLQGEWRRRSARHRRYRRRRLKRHAIRRPEQFAARDLHHQSLAREVGDVDADNYDCANQTKEIIRFQRDVTRLSVFLES
jgi:hypothetical protein